MPKTPMEPVMVEGSAMIRSAAVEIQYPPLAATLPMEATIGMPRDLASMRALLIWSAASTDPPGESTRRTIAFKSFLANASWMRRSEEHTSELQSLMRISYAVFCLKKKTNTSNANKPQTIKVERV